MSRSRPGPGFVNNAQVRAELVKVWNYLNAVLIGPEWRLFVGDGGLYVQKYDAEAGYYKSKALLNSSGNLLVTGTLTETATIADVGRD